MVINVSIGGLLFPNSQIFSPGFQTFDVCPCAFAIRCQNLRRIISPKVFLIFVGVFELQQCYILRGVRPIESLVLKHHSLCSWPSRPL